MPIFVSAQRRGHLIFASEQVVARAHCRRTSTSLHSSTPPPSSHRRSPRAIIIARRNLDDAVVRPAPRGSGIFAGARPSRSMSSGGDGDKAENDDDAGIPPAANDDAVGGNGSSSAGNYFPWRHESTLPARLLARDDLSGMPNNFRARFVRRLVSCKELNLSPWYAIPIPLFARDWEVDLANNFKIAFGLALGELLRSVYRGTVPVIRGDGDLLTMDTMERIAGSGGGANLLENNEYLNRMLDKCLIARYQSFDSDNHRLRFSMRPYEAKLESIFAVPLLSREIVEHKPYLRGAYQRIEKAFIEKASFEEVKRMTYDLANEVGEENAFTRTVIADVTIVCAEFFQVRDTHSGIVVQGMDDEWENPNSKVVHNVRFEVVTERNDDEKDGRSRKVGSWKIIDIDDMLHGNVFH